MSKTKINCKRCNKEHEVETREINRGAGKFCSSKCANQYRAENLQDLELNVECSWCSKKIHLSPSKMSGSKSRLYFCCRNHKDCAQKIGGIKEIMPTHYGTMPPDHAQHYRRIAFENKPKICERCKYDQHPAAIIVHHKDRNRMNDDINNLEVLCANCHAIEHWSVP
jgi:hypothetical protein